MASDLIVGDIVNEMRVAEGGFPKDNGELPDDKPYDGLLAGDLKAPVTGIAVAWSPELGVLKQALAQGCNLVLARDPLYWYDDPDLNKSAPYWEDSVPEGTAGPTKWDVIEKSKFYQTKRDFIASSKINVIRISTNWNGPSGLATRGLVTALGWKATEEFVADEQFSQARAAIVTLPADQLINIAQHAKKSVNAKSVRVIGERSAKISKLVVYPGFMTLLAATRIWQTPGLDAVITGESCEWLGVVYAEDAISADRSKGFIMLGLAAAADASGKEVAAWVSSLHPDAKVQFIPVGDPFIPIMAGGLRA